MNRRMALATAAWCASLVLAGSAVIQGHTDRRFEQDSPPDLSFKLVRSTGAVAANCMPDASANVFVRKQGQAEQLVIHAQGMEPHVGYSVFLIQVPNAPFGVAVYEGDLPARADGSADLTLVGRFGRTSFVVAAGSAVAPVVDSYDASLNPSFAPTHLFHLGVWFKSAAAAVAGGCPNVVTPFNGIHQAGIQLLSTRQFPDTAGPLSRLR